MKIIEHTTEYGTTQILFKDEETGRKAWITRFKGERTWAARGADYIQWAKEYTKPITLHNGKKEQFIKSTAVELAKLFVETGRTYL